MALIYWLIFIAGKYILYAALIIAFLALILVFIVELEMKLLRLGYCQDFYMFPFRLLIRKNRAELQSLINDVCAKVKYIGRIDVKIYFFPGLIIGAPFAFCIVPAKTIFIQKWFLQKIEQETLFFVICHEIGHIVLETPYNNDTRLAGEYAADAFAAMIMGHDAAIASLEKARVFIDLKYKNKNFEFKANSRFEIDCRVQELHALKNRNPISPPPSNAAP